MSLAENKVTRSDGSSDLQESTKLAAKPTADAALY